MTGVNGGYADEVAVLCACVNARFGSRTIYSKSLQLLCAAVETSMVLELPFGGLADNFGRKPVFLTAVVASLISLALFLLANDFFVLSLSFAFIGFGRALRSGTLDAWFVETFKIASPDLRPLNSSKMM